MDWKAEYQKKLVSCEEAVKTIKSGDRIFLSPSAGAPVGLSNALSARYLQLEDVHVYSGLAMYPHEFFKGEYKGHINYHTFFMGPLERKFFPQGNIDVHSMHFSQLGYFVEVIANANVCLLTVSEPDENGYMNYGVYGVSLNSMGLKSADTVIVQVNKHERFVNGENNLIHVSEVDYICEMDRPLPETPEVPATELEMKIASFILPYIKDGDTLQLGIGGVANAVGYGLETKKDLGVHTEILTDSLVYLAQKGVVNGSKKNYYHGQIVAGVGLGTKAVYDFLDRNPAVCLTQQPHVNSVANIAKNDNFVSINGALMSDLTGQIGAESIGLNQYSGTGGQLDFVRGAALSKGGRSFICIPSTTKSKTGGVESTITLTLPPGTAVTTPRSDVMYVVTEYGVADLFNKSLETRAKALIHIAHPDFRDQLTSQAKEAGLIH